MIPTTTRLSTHSPSPSTLVKRSLSLMVLAVSLRLLSPLVSSSLRITPSPPLTSSPNKLTGDALMAATTCPGTRTSTFPNTVAHAGLRELPALLLTDSTSWITLRTPPLSV
jgi:hypothetical protein